MPENKNEFATAARDIIFSGEVQDDEATKDDDNDGDAIDDGDADDDMVTSKRNTAQLRVQRRKSEAALLKKVIPFHWAPMLSPLTENDIDTCMALETAALSDPTHRSTREKIEYRVRKSSGTCYGLFNTYRPHEAKGWTVATLEHSRPVESGRYDKAKHVMFAQILATLGTHPVVTDDDMAVPNNWRDSSACKDSTVGHQSQGRTICLHSFAVCPEVQGVGIGKTAMKSYLQLMNESGMADRVALICQPYAIPFYRGFGFRDIGQSTQALSGQGWHAMVLDLRGPQQKHKEEPTKVPKPKK